MALQTVCQMGKRAQNHPESVSVNNRQQFFIHRTDRCLIQPGVMPLIFHARISMNVFVVVGRHCIPRTLLLKSVEIMSFAIFQQKLNSKYIHIYLSDRNSRFACQANNKLDLLIGGEYYRCLIRHQCGLQFNRLRKQRQGRAGAPRTWVPYTNLFIRCYGYKNRRD